MKLAFYPGCTVQSEQYAYEISAREIFPKLGVELIDIEGFSCCGYPLKNISVQAWLYLSARNLALAEKKGMDLFPLCNGCNLSFRETMYYLEEDPQLKKRINSLLSAEGLRYSGDAKSFHVLEVLRGIIGVDKIRQNVKKNIKGVKLAAHYGCHALRPSKLKMPDDSEDPHSLEELVEALGASTDDYPERLDCCGQGLAMTNARTALTISGMKLEAIRDQGFDGVVTICPFCMKMLDAKQKAIRIPNQQKGISIPVLYYTQLLGLALGLNAEKVALNLNLSPVSKLIEKMESFKT